MATPEDVLLNHRQTAKTIAAGPIITGTISRLMTSQAMVTKG
jgi:hypothetical protein